MRIYKHITANDVRLDHFPFRRELSMEAYIIENERVLSLDDEDFSQPEIIDAEISLRLGRKSKESDGRIDILAAYGQQYVAVVELKLGMIDESHVEQLQDYLKQRKQLLDHYKKITANEAATEPKWLGILIGCSIKIELAKKIQEGLMFEENIPMAALTIQRFRGSDGTILVGTDVFFKQPSSRDNTKYKYNGQSHGKGRLVWSVINQHIKTKSNIKFSDLAAAFPTELQGPSGVFSTSEEANEIYNRTGHKRHFIAADELLNLSDSTIAISNQWGVKNIKDFIKQAQKFGHKIEEI